MTKEEIVERLRKAKGQRKQICAASGVSYRWVNYMLAGAIADPGNSKIDALRNYFLSQDIRHQ